MEPIYDTTKVAKNLRLGYEPRGKPTGIILL